MNSNLLGVRLVFVWWLGVRFFLAIQDFGCFRLFFVTAREERALYGGCFAGSPRIITVNYRLLLIEIRSDVF